MSILAEIKSRGRRSFHAGTALSPISTVVVVADKGGDGKSTFTEILSLTLDDLGLEHTIAECEAAERLGPRLGSRVTNHPLHEEDVKALRADPDLLNVYWDRVHEQWMTGPTITDVGANGLKLLARWALGRTVQSTLSHGAGLLFVLMVTSDTASFNELLNGAKTIKKALPSANIQVVINPMHGEIHPSHPGVAKVLEWVGCQDPIRMPVCPAPGWGTLKNLGAFADVAMWNEDQLEPHGIGLQKAGRALEALQEWLLEACDAVVPIANWMVERAQVR